MDDHQTHPLLHKRNGVPTTIVIGAVVIATVVGVAFYYVGNSGFAHARETTTVTTTPTGLSAFNVTTVITTTTSFAKTVTSTSTDTAYAVVTSTTTETSILIYINCPGQASPPCLPDLDGDGV